MARRTVYGNEWSENGWPMVDQGSCEWITVPGTNPPVSLQIQSGQPMRILRAFAADWNAYVEPLRDDDSACWTPTNSVPTSNHLSGTAIDCNWRDHPFQVSYAGFDDRKIATMREMLDFYTQDGLKLIFWGQDWDSPKDPMHVNLSYNTFGDPRLQKFIDTKIRADGFSTFRRDGQPGMQPPSVPGAVDVLARATGLTTERSAQILPAVTSGLQQSECMNVNRIVMWLAQCGHESAGFNATEEYQNGPMDQERWIYKGRTWIQLTWRSAYAGFGQWCYDRGLVTDPNVFVNNPKSLADLQWAGLGAAYYWTTTRRETRRYPTLNEASDARDILTATQIINGGLNGLDDRTARYNRALALGDQLLALVNTTPPTPVDPFEELLMSDLQVESLSIYATPGEPLIPIVRMVQSIDAADHRQLVEDAARLGDPDSLARIVRTAAGQGKFRDAGTVNHARAVLADIEKTNPAVLQAFNAQNGASK